MTHTPIQNDLLMIHNTDKKPYVFRVKKDFEFNNMTTEDIFELLQEGFIEYKREDNEP